MIHSGTRARTSDFHFKSARYQNRLRNEACEMIVHSFCIFMCIYHLVLQAIKVTTATDTLCQDFFNARTNTLQFANNHISLFKPNKGKSRPNHHKSISLLLKKIYAAHTVIHTNTRNNQTQTYSYTIHTQRRQRSTVVQLFVALLRAICDCCRNKKKNI